LVLFMATLFVTVTLMPVWSAVVISFSAPIAGENVFRIVRHNII